MQMSWLSDFLNHIAISNRLTGALFVASFAVLLGEKFSPEAVGTVPHQWHWAIVGVCIFSGAHVAFSTVPRIWRKTYSVLRTAVNHPQLRPPADREWTILQFIAEKKPIGMMDLDRMLDDAPISKLELLGHCRSLERKGLLRIVGGDSDVVELTIRGREYVLKHSGQKS